MNVRTYPRQSFECRALPVRLARLDSRDSAVRPLSVVLPQSRVSAVKTMT